jgi:hypothetical protein
MTDPVLQALAELRQLSPLGYWRLRLALYARYARLKLRLGTQEWIERRLGVTPEELERRALADMAALDGLIAHPAQRADKRKTVLRV